jgi:uncharacterized protein (DUF362 family)
MSEWNRRDLLKLGAVGLAGVERALSAPPALSIAHYRSSPTAKEVIAEEAKMLTRKAIDALGGMQRFVSKGNSVWVKPNIGWDRSPEMAATTNPDVVAALVEMCFQAGAGKVIVSDNACNPAQRTFPRSGIQVAAEKSGARVFFMDERKFRKMAIKGHVLKEWDIYTDIVESDRVINVAIVKHHGLCKATLGMKNLMGATGGARNRFHQNLDQTVVDLAVFLKPQLVVLDAIRILTANGPTGGNLADVKRKDTIVAGVDQVAVDALGATLLGLRPEELPHIIEANSRGLGTMNYRSLSPVQVEV